jgi:hypothetical protein
MAEEVEVVENGSNALEPLVLFRMNWLRFGMIAALLSRSWKSAVKRCLRTAVKN